MISHDMRFLLAPLVLPPPATVGLLLDYSWISPLMTEPSTAFELPELLHLLTVVIIDLPKLYKVTPIRYEIDMNVKQLVKLQGAQGDEMGEQL